MCEHDVSLKTRAQNYDSSRNNTVTLDPSSSHIGGFIDIEKSPIGILTHFLKRILKKYTHNPHGGEAHNYSIIEDISQAYCAMYAL